MDVEDTPLNTATPGLRERRRRETGRELADAAIALFERKGVHGTTVDDIAEAAGVSPRTFFRYAATKEHAVFLGDEGFDAVMHRARRGIGEGLPVAAALETSWLPLLDQFDDSASDERERALRIRGLVMAEPSLLAVALARDERGVDDLVEAVLAAGATLERRQPPIDELRARAIVTIVGTTVRLAFDEWARRAERGVEATVRGLYSELRRGLAASFADTGP